MPHAGFVQPHYTIPIMNIQYMHPSVTDQCSGMSRKKKSSFMHFWLVTVKKRKSSNAGKKKKEEGEKGGQ